MNDTPDGVDPKVWTMVLNGRRWTERIRDSIEAQSAAISEQTEAINRQTDALDKAIRVASKIGPWAMVAVIIAGIGVAISAYEAVMK